MEGEREKEGGLGERRVNYCRVCANVELTSIA